MKRAAAKAKAKPKPKPKARKGGKAKVPPLYTALNLRTGKPIKVAPMRMSRRRPRDFRVGVVRTDPSPPRMPHKRQARFGLKDAQAVIADPAATAEQLLAAATLMPAATLKHPALALLSLSNPIDWRVIRDTARARIARLKWAKIGRWLTLAHCRLLTVAMLRRQAAFIDALITPPGEPTGATERMAHLLEAVLIGDVPVAQARALLRDGITGGPAPVEMVATSSDQLEMNSIAREALGEVFALIIGPPRPHYHARECMTSRRFTIYRMARKKGRKGSRKKGPVLKRGHAQQAALAALIALDPPQDVEHECWLVEAASALLDGEPLPR